MTALSFGFKTPQQHTDFAAVRDVWLAGDEHPAFEHAWLFDHFEPVEADPGPCLEGWTTLAALAAQTRRLRLGLMVTGNTYRHPAVLAHMLGTVDHIAGGRVSFGLGAGWNQREHEALGLPLPPPGERLARWEEACRLIRGLCDGGRVTFDGKYYRLDDARLDPPPAARVPFVLGAVGDRALGVVARHADVWNVAGGRLAGLAGRIAALHRRCAEIGRDPAGITVSTQVYVGDDLAATRAWTARFLAAGVRHVVFVLRPPFAPPTLDRLAREVIEPLLK